MDQDLKDRLMARTTYHGKDGKFASPASAVTATRNGERLRVVRQLRRLHRAKGKTESVMRTVLRANLAKTKAALAGELSAPGFVNIGDILFQGR